MDFALHLNSVVIWPCFNCRPRDIIPRMTGDWLLYMMVDGASQACFVILCLIYFCGAGILGQTKGQIKFLLGVPSHGFDRPNVVHDENASENMTRDIENSQDNALSLCTEKVLLARQAYDLVLLPSSFSSSCPVA
ncbi:unnamed protein product [Triticum turgidum subsp. durum]|uniref:Uncharacterized protein n=1 Tax=Triticum turgidum subsp. durum TaxID=4567 RepID=A0A9R0WSZ5_TRITD|nr:unnamed protein product [Triticum turgidum subsp. durum]